MNPRNGLRAAFQTLLATLALLSTSAAVAHTGSTAYIDAVAADDTVSVTWRIALRDLDLIADLDANKDGTLTWDEVAARPSVVSALAIQLVTVKAGDTPCVLTADAPTLAKDPEHDLASTRLHGPCAGGPIMLTYSAFVGIDDKHRALARIGGTTEPQVIAPGASIALAGEGAPHSFGDFWREGVGHILAGIDHLLFLVALMLPSVLTRIDGGWEPRLDRKAALIKVVWLATAFTIAHSITLGLAAFGVVRFGPKLIEPLVAATVLAAALNNIWPVVTQRLAAIAFCFGLIHGFAFAEVLAPLHLPRADLALALLGFNLGVETGQLIVVAACFALLALFSRWRGYPRWVLQGGSAVVAVLACAWIAERVFDISLIS